MKKNHLRMLALAMAAMMSLTACGGGSATEMQKSIRWVFATPSHALVLLFY